MSEELNPYADMWNAKYQVEQSARGRKEASEKYICWNALLKRLCRYTIHIGITLICLSFLGVFVIIMNNNEDAVFDY